MEFITKSAAQTKSIGKKIADSLIDGREKRRIIALTGNLGSGKTTFAQGFCRGLGIKDRVISPTFILVRKYRISGGLGGFKDLYHADLYRLEGDLKPELESIGLTDFFREENSIILVEWAEKIKEYLPEEALWIRFEYQKDNLRRIITDYKFKK